MARQVGPREYRTDPNVTPPFRLLRLVLATVSVVSVSVAAALVAAYVQLRSADDGASEAMSLVAASDIRVDRTIASFLPPTRSPSGRVWSAKHERGDLSEWPSATRDWDSGDCTFHGVSRERARSGAYSMKLTIDTSDGQSGCRQARNAEIQTGRAYYYSAWYFLPRPVTPTEDHWNVFQFKSKVSPTTDGSDPMWTIDFEGKPLRPVLAWKGGGYGLEGPQAGDGEDKKWYYQKRTRVPIGRWTQIEVYFKQSRDFGGRITVWHGGTRIFDVRGVRTRHPEGVPQWTVNNYSSGLSVSPYTLYLDDVAISTVRSSRASRTAPAR